MQGHVHGRFVDCKGFPTLKVDNFMHKLVKKACNFDANMNYTSLYSVSFSNQRL